MSALDNTHNGKMKPRPSRCHLSSRTLQGARADPPPGPVHSETRPASIAVERPHGHCPTSRSAEAVAQGRMAQKRSFHLEL